MCVIFVVYYFPLAPDLQISQAAAWLWSVWRAYVIVNQDFVLLLILIMMMMIIIIFNYYIPVYFDVICMYLYYVSSSLFCLSMLNGCTEFIFIVA